MLSNSGHDSRGQYSGDTAGDQGGEWSIIPWYQYPYGGWNCILRHPNATVREWIATLATEAANNDNIGYDQSERYTFWQALQKCGYRPKNINYPVEADCSAGVLAICRAVGYLTGDAALQGVDIYGYTGTEKRILTNAGFQVLGDSKYLTGDSYLCRGDILLNEENHTCINLTDGANVSPSESTDDSEEFTFTTKNIYIGSKGINVYRLQTILKARGFYKGTIDRSFGEQTRQAVIAFQKKAGLTVDGVCGNATWATLLGLDRTASGAWKVENVGIGTMKNKSVLLCQEFMKGSGYGADVDLDWNFGPKTKMAVQKFQKATKKLEVNGRFDKATARWCIGEG